MNFGRFFELDHNSSRIDSDILIFRYNGLRILSSETGLNSPEYPIYLSISKDSVDFRVHYFYQENPEASIYEQGGFKHLHEVILTLPLSANLEVKDGLTLALAQSFDMLFPIEDPFSKRDLFSMICYHEKVRSSTHDSLGLGTSYSSLEVFNVYNSHGELIAEIVNKRIEVRRFIRKLVLDFLFDLEHTKIFQNSVYYEHLSIKLKENFFFSALANKAQYYFYRALLNEEDLSVSSISLYIDCLIQSEKEWSKSIRHISSDQVFQLSNGWFERPECEMSSIFNNAATVSRKLYCISKETRGLREIALESSKWFTRRYALSYLYHPLVRIVLLLLLVLFPIACLAPLKFESCHTDYWTWLKLSIVVTTMLIAFFQRVWNFRGIHPYSPRLIISITTGWVTIYFGSGMFHSFDDITHSGLIIGIAIGLMSLCIGFFIYSEVGKLNPFHNTWPRLLRTVTFLLVGFMYSYTVGKLIFILKKTDSGVEFGDKIKLRLLFESSSYKPGAFFLFTFFAMFIGIFLQLISQEKPATDSI